MKLDWKKIIPSDSNSRPWMELLRRYVTHKITEAEFNSEIAYGALPSIKALVYKLKPVMSTTLADLINRKKASRNMKDRERLAEAISKHSKFFDDQSHVNTSNRSNIMWLKEYLSWLPAEDQVSRSKIIEVIKTHDSNFRSPDTGTDNQRSARDLPGVSESNPGSASPNSEHKDKQEAVS